MAVEEMRIASFIPRLTAIIETQARKAGLLRGRLLPGGKGADDLALEITVAVLRGQRQWKEGKNFFEACTDSVRSTVDNWKNKAANMVEWRDFDAASEEWSESDELKRFPGSDAETPHETAIRLEAANRRDNELLELAGMVEPGTSDEKIVSELMDHEGAATRAAMVAKYGLTGEEYDAALKRIMRKAAKITANRKVLK